MASVGLFSEVPVEKVEKVLMDYQSKTSVKLCEILLKQYWKINAVVENATEDYIKHINGTTAGIVIGDRALQQRMISHYVYDLGEAWKAMTGLPFVFAAWIANKKLPGPFITSFNEANAVGLKNIEAVIQENVCSVYDLRTYYTRNISFDLTDAKKKGLEYFLYLLRNSNSKLH